MTIESNSILESRSCHFSKTKDILLPNLSMLCWKIVSKSTSLTDVTMGSEGSNGKYDILEGTESEFAN